MQICASPPHPLIPLIGLIMSFNVLIIQTAFIGDVALVTPLIQAAKERLDARRLVVVVRPSTAELLRHNPYVDEVLPYDKNGAERGLSGLLSLAGRLCAERFDLALVPHRSIRSALLSWLARIPVRSGFDTSAGRWLLTHRLPYRAVHEVERNLDLLQPWKVGHTGYAPSLFPSDEDRTFAEHFLHRHGMEGVNLLMGMSPGSIWATKRWLPERFADVARRAERELAARILLLGGPDDIDLCRTIAERAGGSPVVVAGQATLLQSAALVARCAALVSNDSAMAHLAAAMGTRVIGIFGPTVPAFGFTPYGDGHHVIEHTLLCRPCGRHGGVRCPIGTHECMTGVTVDRVFDKINEVVYDLRATVGDHKNLA